MLAPIAGLLGSLSVLARASVVVFANAKAASMTRSVATAHEVRPPSVQAADCRCQKRSREDWSYGRGEWSSNKGDVKKACGCKGDVVRLLQLPLAVQVHKCGGNGGFVEYLVLQMQGSWPQVRGLPDEQMTASISGKFASVCVLKLCDSVYLQGSYGTAPKQPRVVGRHRAWSKLL